MSLIFDKFPNLIKAAEFVQAIEQEFHLAGAIFTTQVQNWFCEISKYLRGYSKNKYSAPAGTIKPLPEPVFPSWW